MRMLHIFAPILLAFAPVAAGQYGLATTFQATTGFDGNMFDVVAKRDILITRLDVNLSSSASEVRVYVVEGGGSFVGMENSSFGWDLIKQTTVTSLGEGLPTPIPLDLGIFIPAGQTQGLYVTINDAEGGSMRYSVGSNFGGVAARDASLSILEGIGKEFAFGSTLGTPSPGGSSRIWNGRLHYRVIEEVTTYFTGTNGHDGVMFDVRASKHIAIQEIEVNLDAGNQNVAVWAVKDGGSFVGHEMNSSEWTLAGAINVTSAGVGPTRVPITLNLPIDAGDTRGLYVTSYPTGGPSMKYTTGTNFGGAAATDGALTIYEGVGCAYPFAGTFGSTTPGGSSRIFNGTIRYSYRPLGLPHTEGFETVPGGGTAEPPRGWLQDLNDASPATVNSDWLFRDDEPSSMNGPMAGYGPSGGTFAYIEDSDVGDHAEVNLLSRPIELAVLRNFGALTVTFWVNSNDAGPFQNPLAVDVIEYPLAVEHRDVRPQVGSTNGAWTQFLICLTPYDGPFLQLRFRGRTDNGHFNNDVGLDHVAVGYFLGPLGTGQVPQFGLATLDINSAGEPSQCAPVPSGLPGPYTAVAHGGATMDITITSEPARPVLFFAGQTNPAILDLGAIGLLDVGNIGATNIVLIADGNGTGFLDSLFRTNASGDLSVALPTPAPLVGFNLGFQVITFNSSPSAISLSNAVEVTFIP